MNDVFWERIIAKRNRSEDFTVIGSYIGLRLLVRSDYSLDGTFDRNSFFIESVSGLKYRCGLSGALPQGFADSALYPQTTLAAIPTLIARQREQSTRLEGELPTLQDIAARRWPKSAELARLKSDCKALQQRIDTALKAAEQPTEPTDSTAAPTAEPSAHTKPQAASNPAA